MTTSNQSPLGIIAGGGDVPTYIANAATRSGRPVFIVAIEGEADPGIEAFPHELLKWGQIGRMESVFHNHGVKELVLVGNISKLPDYTRIRLDMGALRVVPKVLKLIRSGDNNLLSGVIALLADMGFTVIGAHEVAPELVAGEGPLGAKKPTDSHMEDLALAMEASRAIGKLDAGQAAVAINGRVVALEAAEGTDGMLERVASLRESGRFKWKGQAGVLAKCAKPQQDLRVDMPTIGPRTVRSITKIGLAGIAVEAGRVMIVDRPKLVRLADKNGVFVTGRPVTDEEGG